MKSPELQPAEHPAPMARVSVGAANDSTEYQTYDLVQNLEAEASHSPQPSHSPGNPASEAEARSMMIATLLPSPATDFRWENGRRYNAYAQSKYLLPNDEQEMSRLELQHEIWAALFKGKLHLAPLGPETRDVLDLGTGTGRWAHELTKRRPNMRVVGTDLSPIQPVPAPPNCSWVMADANDDWPEHFAGAFDYVHTRTLGLGVTSWPRLLDQAARALRPGGWIELQEFYLPIGCDDGSLDGTALMHWGELMVQGAAAGGVNLRAALELSTELTARGFDRVRQVRLKAPIGPWAKGQDEKRCGVDTLKDMHDNLLGISVKLFAEAAWPHARTAELCEQAKNEMNNPKVHGWVPLLVVWAQKPLAESEHRDTVMTDVPAPPVLGGRETSTRIEAIS